MILPDVSAHNFLADGDFHALGDRFSGFHLRHNGVMLICE